MSLSATRLLLLGAAFVAATPVFAQQKGFTVTWSVTMKSPGEVKDKNGRVTHIEPNRTYKATEILGPFKEGQIPPGEMEALSNAKDPTVYTRMIKDSQVAVPVTGQKKKAVTSYSFNDSFIETTPFSGEANVVTSEGQEGTIVGSGFSTYYSAGSAVTTLSYSVSKKEYQIWLPFYMLNNGQKVDKTYYNFTIDEKGVKKVDQPPAFKASVDPTSAAILQSVTGEILWPILKVAGPLPLKINKTMKILYLMPNGSTPVPIDTVVNVVVTSIK